MPENSGRRYDIRHTEYSIGVFRLLPGLATTASPATPTGDRPTPGRLSGYAERAAQGCRRVVCGLVPRPGTHADQRRTPVAPPAQTQDGRSRADSGAPRLRAERRA